MSSAHCNQLDPINLYLTTSQAVNVPIAPAMAPTDIIKRTVVETYRGRVVEIKCGQILLAGKSARKTTDNIGNTINAEIDNAHIAQLPLAFKNGIF
tara:strand:- start:1512 stop:1799 length:288 start_codon:yes stop_codon:yes gene_type:complete